MYLYIMFVYVYERLKPGASNIFNPGLYICLQYVVSVSKLHVCTREKHIHILEVRPYFFQDLWLGFCCVTAVLASVELPEEHSFFCVKHDEKGLKRQQLECGLLLLEFIRPVWQYRWAEGCMSCPSRPSVVYRLEAGLP